MITVAVMEKTIDNSPKPALGSGHIRTLDGWRTIAVGAVIWYHAVQIPLRPLQGIQNFGIEGVALFFAISGILICSRLLEEQRVNGRISLGGFYLRRICRIQPPAIVYLLVLAVLAAFGTLHFSWWGWVSSLFSYRNFYDAAGGGKLVDDRYASHFWSLAVEEHFYLILPLLIACTKRRLVPVLLFVTALSMIWPPVVHRVHFLQAPELGRRTDIVVQSLFVAALLAVLLTLPRIRKVLIQATARGLLIGLTVALLVVAHVFLKDEFVFQICTFGFPLAVISTVLHPENWLGRLLETRLFAILGKMSYSLYLWQQLFFMRAEFPFAPYPLRYLQVWPWNLAAVMLCAACSYYLIEKPFIRLGHRLAPPATSGRDDLHEHLLSQRSRLNNSRNTVDEREA
jgi:peptidoglycan/LPS O-acetylase OafA/YrhL